MYAQLFKLVPLDILLTYFKIQVEYFQCFTKEQVKTVITQQKKNILIEYVESAKQFKNTDYNRKCM